MQLALFGDMGFPLTDYERRLPLPQRVGLRPTATTPLPVLVYFYGGGNVAGDSSEPRYDGARLAQQGLVVVTVNYRLSVFGFFAHPELKSNQWLWRLG
jgi:para-nitrobenzyl esterase